jgi:hypothetical protein
VLAEVVGLKSHWSPADWLACSRELDRLHRTGQKAVVIVDASRARQVGECARYVGLILVLATACQRLVVVHAASARSVEGALINKLLEAVFARELARTIGDGISGARYLESRCKRSSAASFGARAREVPIRKAAVGAAV